MRRIAELIVKSKKLLLVLFAAAALGCLFTISKVEVINELTEYLPEDTETRQGVDIMDKEFTTFGTAKVMVDNISYQEACRLADVLEEIKGVSEVSFYKEEEEDEKEITDGEGLKDSYNGLAALFSITFETEEEEDTAQYAIADVRTALKDYDTSFYTTVDKDDSADLQEEMRAILVIAVAIIVFVLWFTSGTYMEIAIFMLVFAMAALLNMGTNFIFGDISFITNAVGTVLQLALAIRDYYVPSLYGGARQRGYGGGSDKGFDKRNSGDRIQLPDYGFRYGGADVYAVRHRHGYGACAYKSNYFKHAVSFLLYAGTDYDI